MKIGLLYNSPMNIGNATMAINFAWYTNLLLSGKAHFVISTIYNNSEKEIEKIYRLELGNNVSFSVVKGQFLYGRDIIISLINPLNKNSLSKKLASEILSSDIIVALGGDIFASTYGESNTVMELMGLYLFKKKTKKPVLLLSQTIGPFSGWRDRIGAHLLRKFDIITCRERLTYKYLANKGLRNISLVADLAFLHLPRRPQVGKKEELVVLAPSRLLHKYMPRISYEEYVKLWADLALYVRDQGFKVMFLPHAVNNEWDDDRLIIRDIQIELHRKARDLREIYFVYNIPLPHEARCLYIGKSTVVITARMHAAISAICTGSIPINLAYGEKSHGVLGKDFQLSNLIVDVRKVRSVKELKRRIVESFKYILTSHKATQQEIIKKYRDKEREALKNIYLFVKLIKG